MLIQLCQQSHWQCSVEGAQKYILKIKHNLNNSDMLLKSLYYELRVRNVTFKP